MPKRLLRENMAAVAAAAIGLLLVVSGLLFQLDSIALTPAARVASAGVEIEGDQADPPPAEAPPQAAEPSPTETPVPPTPTAAPALAPLIRASETATPIPPPATVTTVPTATRAVARAAAGAGVPILMYHYIRVNPDPNDTLGYGLSITPPLFQAQMDFLAERGFQVVPMRDIQPYVGTGKVPDERTAVVTLDDGYRDAYTEAWPVLRERGFGATMYVITDLIDNDRYLTRAQIKELADRGVEIGDHSATHSELPALTGARLRREVVDSRDVLERIVGGPIASFCYPSGHYNATTRAAVQAAGYGSAVTVEPGIFRGREDRFQIPRVRVYGGMGLAQFARAIGEPPPDPKKWAAFLNDVPAPPRRR